MSSLKIQFQSLTKSQLTCKLKVQLQDDENEIHATKRNLNEESNESNENSQRVLGRDSLAGSLWSRVSSRESLPESLSGRESSSRVVKMTDRRNEIVEKVY